MASRSSSTIGKLGASTSRRPQLVASLRPAAPRPRPVAQARPTLQPSQARCFASAASPPPPSPFKPPRWGQPTPLTHPHLLAPDEVRPGLSAADFEDRRRRLVAKLAPGGIVVLLGAKIQYSSQNIFHKFRQQTDFMYLTGFNEPDSALILQRDDSVSRGYRMTLFVPLRTAQSDLWDGGRSGLTGAVELFHADEAFALSRLPDVLGALLPQTSTVYIDLPPSKSKRSFFSSLLPYAQSSVETEASLGKLPANKLKPLAGLVHELRGIKSEAEVRIMKAAADISAKAHTEVMRFAEPGASEAHLVAHFEYICSLAGSQRPAYVPVVASGANSLVIHYTENDCLLQSGELVLIDAGAELDSYASDITRTFPVSGTFSSAQRDLYEAVLQVNKRCIALCELDQNWSSNAMHTASVRMMREELNQIGFNLNSDASTSELYPHGLSHFLGMDLHDCPTMRKDAAYAAGNVTTIEPGVYVPFSSRYPKHFHGLGIRIEDDVLFTKDGPVVLTANCPKEVVDVEGACQGLLRP